MNWKTEAMFICQKSFSATVHNDLDTGCFIDLVFSIFTNNLNPIGLKKFTIYIEDK